MQIRSIHKALLFFAVLIFISAHAAIVSRVTSFSDGSILYAADSNSEFNNIINTVNNLDNDNLSAMAAISPAKISATIDGSGISRNGTTGALSVSVDDTTIEISGDSLRVKAASVGNAQFRDSAGLSVVGRASNTTGSVADITAGSDNTVLQRSGTSLVFASVDSNVIASSAVTTAKIANLNVTTGKLADGAVTPAKLSSLNIASSSSISFTTTSTSLTAVTNSGAAITTNGRPVAVMLRSTGAGECTIGATNSTSGLSQDLRGSVEILRDSTDISDYQYGHITTITTVGDTRIDTQVLKVPGTSIQTIDAPVAGSYTYSLKLKSNNSATTTSIGTCVLTVYEL